MPISPILLSASRRREEFQPGPLLASSVYTGSAQNAVVDEELRERTILGESLQFHAIISVSAGVNLPSALVRTWLDLIEARDDHDMAPEHRRRPTLKSNAMKL